MRDIEFRAWDSINNIMLNHDKKYKTIGEWFRMCESRGIVEFEQYTGLLDNNGVKIFKGDIVEAVSCFSAEYKNDACVYYVDFKYGTFLFADKYKNLIRQWSDGIHDWYSIENVETFNIKVIGNIHEKKELLENTYA